MGISRGSGLTVTEKQIINRELREAEIKMTGRPPTSAVGFIGFVPAVPSAPPAGGQASASGSPTHPQRQALR